MPVLTPTGAEVQIGHKADRVKGRFPEEEGLERHPEVFEGVDGLKGKCGTPCSDNARQ